MPYRISLIRKLIKMLSFLRRYNSKIIQLRFQSYDDGAVAGK